jgi:PAS domain S-box-containing protein
MRVDQAGLLAILDATTDAVVVIDRTGTIVLFNRAAEALFGWAAAQAVGRDVSVLMPSPHRDAHAGHLARYLETREARVIGIEREVEGLRRDGSTFPASLRVTGLDHGGSTYFIGIVQDVTAARALRKRLAVADRLASIGLIAASVAHEISNPLAALMADLAVARHSGDSGPVRAAIADAQDCADRIRTVLADLQRFARPEAEIGGRADLSRVLETSIRMAWNVIRHRARLTRRIETVPPIAASEGRLGQVLLNLLVNAAQAIPAGRVNENEIVVTARAEGDRARVEISDTGEGIRPEDFPRLFDAFFTTKAAEGGTGLGLAVCHGIVTSLGGEISVTSEPGRGSTFRVLFPLAPRPPCEDGTGDER